SYYSVALAFTAFFFMITAAAILTLIILFRSAIFVPSNRCGVFVVKLFIIRTYKIPISIHSEIYRPIWIVSVFSIFAFLIEHCKFHVLFHPMFFTIQIVIKTAVTCICYRILRILVVCPVVFFHERLKTIHIRCISFYVIYCYILITYAKLNIVSR